MKISKDKLKLYAITDSRLLKSGETLADVVEQAISGGATIIQLREKGKSAEEIIETAKSLKAVCKKYNVPLIVNDSAEIAQKSGADGVHLGLDDGSISYARKVMGENAIIGATAHNLSEAERAVSNGADYIGCGAVFTSVSKDDTIPLSIYELSLICSKITEIPITAIGGINAQNIFELKNTGIAGVAVISAIFGQENISGAAAELAAISKKLFG